MSCSTVGHSPGPIDEFSAGKLLLSLHDNDGTLPCVSDPALYLRALRPRLEEQQQVLKEFLEKNKPKPDACLASCVCDEWLDVHSELASPLYQGKDLRHLQENARNQPLALCLKKTAQIFCGSKLEIDLLKDKTDFESPNP